MTIAQLYIRLRETDQAFEWLQKAVAERSAPFVYLKVQIRRSSFGSQAYQPAATGRAIKSTLWMASEGEAL